MNIYVCKFCWPICVHSGSFEILKQKNHENGGLGGYIILWTITVAKGTGCESLESTASCTINLKVVCSNKPYRPPYTNVVKIQWMFNYSSLVDRAVLMVLCIHNADNWNQASPLNLNDENNVLSQFLIQLEPLSVLNSATALLGISDFCAKCNCKFRPPSRITWHVQFFPTPFFTEVHF